LRAPALGQGSAKNYLLFTGSRDVLVPAEAVLDAVGSPAWGEEGFAPAGFIFAAGVLAFAAAVPAVAFSPLGVPEPAPAPPPAAPPPAASNDETGAAAKASAKAKAHDVLFNIIFLLVPHTGATTSLQRGGRGVGGYHLPHFTLIRPTLPAIPGRSRGARGPSLGFPQQQDRLLLPIL
jgi:hypothetical protein